MSGDSVVGNISYLCSSDLKLSGGQSERLGFWKHQFGTTKRESTHVQCVSGWVGTPDLVLAFFGFVPSVPQVPSNKYCLKDLGGKGPSYKECIKSFVSGLSESCF